MLLKPHYYYINRSGAKTNAIEQYDAKETQNLLFEGRGGSSPSRGTNTRLKYQRLSCWGIVGNNLIAEARMRWARAWMIVIIRPSTVRGRLSYYDGLRRITFHRTTINMSGATGQ